MRKATLFAVLGTLLVLCGLALTVVVASQDDPLFTPPPPTEMPLLSVTPTLVNLIPLPSTISGIVMDADGVPLSGAIVQVQGTPDRILTSENGAFTLYGIEGMTPITVTAWSTGHYVGWSVVNPSAPDWTGGGDINVTLRPLPTRDYSEYTGFEFEGVRGSASCGICHREYTEWQADLHAHSSTNPHFVTLYLGTNVDGEQGQPIQYGSDGIPLPPDPDLPYYGPGFRLDNTNRAGNCATCHTPLASTAPNNQNCSWYGCHSSVTIEHSNGLIPPAAIPFSLTNRQRDNDGITCEFCHQVSRVEFNTTTNLPYPDMPGILSMKLNRPANEDDQVFFGTLVDVTRQDSYLPLLSQSEFCAGCHHAEFGGVVGMGEVKDGVLIYSSYSEWLDSPYSDPETGMTCQNCHMPESDANWFVLPERGGLERDYATLHNHTMPGASDEAFLQNAVTMLSSAERSGDQLSVEVSITNDRAGHHIPTDVPIRSMILVVEARDANGDLLPLLDGSINPDYSGDYGGVPGKTFAKVLRDEWTGEMPTAAFWRPITIAEDTRLPALATDITRYQFDAPAGTEVTVSVRLIFRRAFYELARQKGWTDPDILMEQETLHIPANEAEAHNG